MQRRQLVLVEEEKPSLSLLLWEWCRSITAMVSDPALSSQKRMREKERWGGREGGKSNPLHGRQLYQPSQSPIKDRSQEKPGVHTLEKISTLMPNNGFAFCRVRRGYSWEEGLLDTVIPYSVLNPTRRSESQVPWLRTELITANLLFQLQWPFHSIAIPLKYH